MRTAKCGEHIEARVEQLAHGWCVHQRVAQELPGQQPALRSGPHVVESSEHRYAVHVEAVEHEGPVQSAGMARGTVSRAVPIGSYARPEMRAATTGSALTMKSINSHMSPMRRDERVGLYSCSCDAVIDDFGCGSRSQHLRPWWLHRHDRLEW